MERFNQNMGTKKDLVLYRIQTAKSALNAARILLDAEEYKGANNRAYYAVFHAINAVHALKGNGYKRHKDANGNYVILRHTISGKTVYSFYAHLASYNVKTGQTVSKGNKIGVVGNTGTASRGKHLHFAMMNTLWSSGAYYGYSTYFSGNKVTYSGVTYYNPVYVIQNNRLP